MLRKTKRCKIHIAGEEVEERGPGPLPPGCEFTQLLRETAWSGLQNQNLGDTAGPCLSNKHSKANKIGERQRAEVRVSGGVRDQKTARSTQGPGQLLGPAADRVARAPGCAGFCSCPSWAPAGLCLWSLTEPGGRDAVTAPHKELLGLLLCPAARCQPGALSARLPAAFLWGLRPLTSFIFYFEHGLA